MTNYVVGFAFSKDKQYVAVIRKLRPRWQNCLLNGIGGHMAENETYGHAQLREFYEETGVEIPVDKWQAFATLNGPDYTVRVFRAFTDEIFNCITRTDEEVLVRKVSDVIQREDVIPNLAYLIPLALDEEQQGLPTFFYKPRLATAASNLL